MKQAIIALGSNLSEPIKQVKNAIDVILSLDKIQVIACSSLYRTTPVGYTAQPDFINAVMWVKTDYSALELLSILQNIEQQFGRERSFCNAPRTLDLDIIDYENEVWQTNVLVLPHPRAHERAFVMYPLAQIAPNYQINGKTAQHWQGELSNEGVMLFE